MKERFEALDSWRGVCALLVAIGHLPLLGHFFDLGILRNSTLFVDFFFVLSGYVIAHAYATMDFPKFARRRFLRLYPLHVLILAAFVALELLKLIASHYVSMGETPFTGDRSIPTLISNLFLAQALGLHDRTSWNTPSWSISVEFYTYLIFALASLFPRLAAYLVLAGIGLVGVALAPSGMESSNDFGIFRCMYGFFIGALVRYLRPAAAPVKIPEWIMVALVAVFVGFGKWPYLAPLVFGATVLVFSYELGPISRLFRTPPFQALGKWSYSIYMVHYLLITILMSAVNVLDIPLVEHRGLELIPGNPFLLDAAALVYVAAVIGLSALTYRFIELPGQKIPLDRWIGRLFPPSPPSPPTAAKVPVSAAREPTGGPGAEP